MSTLHPLPEAADEADGTGSARRRWRDLDGVRREQLSHLVLDALGLAAAGSANDDARRIVAGLAAVSAGEVEVPWIDERLAAPQAVTALSALIHAWDFDDTHDDAVVHTATVVVPAALVAARTAGASGERVMDGVATGVHVLSRLARLVGPRPGVVRTAGLGSIAAAATVATVWDLDEDALEGALGLALGSALAPTTRQTVVDGSVAKRVQPGLAAAHGVVAAALARTGLRGPGGWLSGSFGLLPGSELTLADVLADPDELDQVALKPYPACRYGHAAIAAGEQLLVGDPDGTVTPTVDRIVAHLPAGAAYEIVARPWADRGSPLVDVQFSLPWQLAALQVTGRYDLATLRQDLGRDDVAAAAARVEVLQDLPESTVMSGARVELHTVDGDVRIAEAEMPGAGEHRLDRAAVDRKLLGCLAVGGAADPRAAADELWALVAAMPDLGPRDLASVLAAATPARP